MEEVHGVDVSWLHHPNKEHHHHHHRKEAPSSPGLTRDQKPPTSSNGGLPSNATQQNGQRSPELNRDGGKNFPFPAQAQPTSAKLSTPEKDTTTALPTPPASNTSAKPTPTRPSLLSRQSADRTGASGKKEGSRRPSFLTNISSRFSSAQTTPTRSQPPPQQSATRVTNGTTPNAVAGASPPAKHAGNEEVEEPEPYFPSKPKEGSFFSNLTRRLSSASQNAGVQKVSGTGGVCPRKVLNVDPNRERCLVPELDANKLRRVSFCVDVEIAGGPRYTEDVEDDAEKKKRRKAMKLKERAEGEAMKHPEAIKDEKEEAGQPKLDAKADKASKSSKLVDIPDTIDDEAENDEDASPPIGSVDSSQGDGSRKKEKKKRSEAERKERKEKKLRRAQENGCIPVELNGIGDDGEATNSSADGTPLNRSTTNVSIPPTSTSAPAVQPPAPAKQDRPTTDPVRIYRRCCQLRETPILKRITEQLMSPKCHIINEPGVVNCLDLTGSRLQLADVVTLGDWLAVVPVKRLLLEDADLNDEGVRVILAGLLAAKRPQPTKRRSQQPRHRERVSMVGNEKHQERTGVVEKITLKNNPRITKLGWKHISLFIYMCRSIKAMDLSMNAFPDLLPMSPSAAIKSPPAPGTSQRRGTETDAAELLYKCLSERLGGSKLEELSLSECGLDEGQIRKVVDGAIMCGISRLGLAGNHLDDEGLGHVIHYLRSGVCHGLDLGGNDLRGRLGMIGEAIMDKADLPCWGLSLAGCNLDSASLKLLFPALVKLPNFRFIDLSHNRDLCMSGEDNGTISLLRRYIPQLKDLKRIHLADVGMTPKQAIALADVLPEGPRLAHLSILENPELSRLANANEETSVEMQEEACALYAALMAAVRVSKTVICVDIDVPSNESSEVVKALAKQVVAYSLRNMEQFALAEVTGDVNAATAALTAPHGGEKQVKEVSVPDVLMHLVGHVEGNSENHDHDAPAPDDDYIVGGTGVVKALQYVLGEKANDLRRTSYAGTPTSGALTPRERPGSSAGLDQAGRAKAKEMSKNLLGSARKIRARLQPALVKEATAGDELAYRRLLFLDQTLQSMIQRFEEEYPETRIAPALPQSPRLAASITSSLESKTVGSSEGAEASTLGTEAGGKSDDEDEFEDAAELRPSIGGRHDSTASLASRALTLEEGRLHRLGQHLRREVVNSPSTGTPTTSGSAPWKEEQRLKELATKIEAISGEELRDMVEAEGWEETLSKVGANFEDLRSLQQQDPEGWEQFKEAHLASKQNVRDDRSV